MALCDMIYLSDWEVINKRAFKMVKKKKWPKGNLNFQTSLLMEAQNNLNFQTSPLMEAQNC